MKLRVLALALLAGCPEPTAVACDDGLFCPPSTTCGGSGVCLVDEAGCAAFEDGAPCALEVGRGYCKAAICEVGVEVIGATGLYPILAFVPDVHVTVLGHPEVLPAETNPNGYFGVLGTPRDTQVVLELTYADSLPIHTRRIAVGQTDVLADAIYGTIPIIRRDVVDEIAEMVGATIDPTRGLVAGSTYDVGLDLPVADVVTTLAGADCVGPHYFGPSGPIVGATATLAETGVYAFFNCRPGTYELVATHPDRFCRAFDAELLGPVALEVAADRMLFVGRIVCQ